MRVGVIGTGYVGSVTGACLASEGHEVVLADIMPEKVDAINAGRSPIEEPGLEDLISDTVKEGNLRATTDLGQAVTGAEVVLLSLPTNSAENGAFNLTAVYSVAGELGDLIEPGTVVATRSTVPVGTTERVGKLITAKTSKTFFPVSNPEFLAEGRAVEDTLHPSRIVIGNDSDEAVDIMRGLYRPFVLDNPNKIIATDIRSAEMTKLAANAILATDITITNVIAEICERAGADYRQVQVGAGMDPRIGKFLHPGPGYGGSCFPKDVRALAYLAKEVGLDSRFLDGVSETNEHMKFRLFEKVRDYFNGDLSGRKIGVWGISFKPNTDDIRESAALSLIDDLTAEGAQVAAFDPKANNNARGHFAGNDKVKIVESKYDAAVEAEALVVVTEWGTFRSADFDHLEEIMQDKVVFDARSIYDRQELERAGFYYDSVGRQVVKPNEG